MISMIKTANKTRPIGRILRLLMGIFFITEVVPVYRDVLWEGVVIRLGWVVGLVFIYVVMHQIIIKYFLKFNKIVGAMVAFVPFFAMFFIGYGGPAATGALTFIAVSLIMAGLRADSGCEVMSLPALFLGKHTHLACLLFSPIDWIEKRLTK